MLVVMSFILPKLPAGRPRASIVSQCPLRLFDPQKQKNVVSRFAWTELISLGGSVLTHGMNTRVTVAMVARRAGVHTTSVSLALRNHPSLPLATRRRLRELAARMGYRRDPALSALITYRRHNRPNQSNPLLAYVTDWDTRWGWKDALAHKSLFDGAAAKATELGFQIEHFWLGESGVTHQRISRIPYSKGIKGLVLASHRLEFSDPLDFDRPKFSGVKIDFSPSKQRLHVVTNDQRTIAGLATRQVQAAGYRRIGFVIDHGWDEFVDRAWSAGFLAEQQTIEPKDRIPILFFSPPRSEPGLVSARDDFGPKKSCWRTGFASTGRRLSAATARLSFPASRNLIFPCLATSPLRRFSFKIPMVAPPGFNKIARGSANWPLRSWWNSCNSTSMESRPFRPPRWSKALGSMVPQCQHTWPRSLPPLRVPRSRVAPAGKSPSPDPAPALASPSVLVGLRLRRCLQPRLGLRHGPVTEPVPSLPLVPWHHAPSGHDAALPGLHQSVRTLLPDAGPIPQHRPGYGGRNSADW